MSKKTVTKAVAVQNSRAVALPQDLADEFSPYVKRDAASTRGASGWQYISTKGAQFRMGQNELGTELDVVVLGAIRENLFYSSKYDPDSPGGPDCLALDLEQDEAKMAPPTELASKQSDACVSCEKNAFKSGDNGRGKACKNTVRLVLMNWCEGDLRLLSEAEGARLRVPVTSLKAWATYSDQITKGAMRPLFTARTRITISPDPKNQMKMGFSLIEFIQDREQLMALKRRTDEGRDHLTQIVMPDPSRQAAAAAVRGTGKTKGLVRKTIVRKAAKAKK